MVEPEVPQSRFSTTAPRLRRQRRPVWGGCLGFCLLCSLMGGPFIWEMTSSLRDQWGTGSNARAAQIGDGDALVPWHRSHLDVNLRKRFLFLMTHPLPSPLLPCVSLLLLLLCPSVCPSIYLSACLLVFPPPPPLPLPQR